MLVDGGRHPGAGSNFPYASRLVFSLIIRTRGRAADYSFDINS